MNGTVQLKPVASRMLRVLVVLLLPLVIIAYDEKEKCNVFLSDVNITWEKLMFEEGWTRNGLEDLHDAYTIKIFGEDIPTLCTDTFANFPALKYLELKSNKITRIQPGTFSKADKIEDLYLNDNHLEEIKEGVFNFLNVKILHLEKNSIEIIYPNAFDDMPGLYLLYLSDNRIRSINSEWFKNTPGIIALYLARNEITSVQAYAFENLKGRHVLKYSRQEVFLSIDLSDNKIKYVHSQAFDNFQEIGRLSLRGNQIEHLSENLFSTVTYMKHLWLNVNRIQCFPDNFENLMKAENLIVWYNPWNCTCLDVVKEWADKNKRTIELFVRHCME